MTQASINQCPNAHARPPSLRLGPEVALVGGYQSYTAFPKAVIPEANDRSLCRKQALLAPYFTPSLLEHRTVLDLGANHAFFALWAMHVGAAQATAVDMDPQCQALVGRAAAHLHYDRIRYLKSNLQQYQEPADIVLALALVHWVYSCTADFGSLDAVIGWLASLARHALIVEWIAPRDGAIANFHHTEFNPDAHREPYAYPAFRAALDRHFPRVTFLGHVNDTRALFLAHKNPEDLDLSGPLPLLYDVSKIISSRYLASAGSLHFWSRVYDLGDRILKQSSFDLASREATFLDSLSGPSFPRALATAAAPGYSTLHVEKIRGIPLREAAAPLSDTPAHGRDFINACFDILDQLAAHRITHRDVRPDNILIRAQLPVLIDFGWAISPEAPYYTPDPFLGQPANCDLIGMAEVIRVVAGNRFPAIMPVLAAMASEESRFAVTDLVGLRGLFNQALEPA